jgi:hypothetical protein
MQPRSWLGLDPRDWIGVGLLVAGLVLGGIFVSGRWISIAGTVATVVGLAFAVGQIRLARKQITQAVSVAEATQKAVTTTRAKVARNMMIESIAGLQQIDRDLFAAISDKKQATDIADHLASWRDGAYNVYSLIKGAPHASPDLVDGLLSSAKEAAELRDELPEGNADLKKATSHVRSEISGVCGLLGALQTTVKLDMEEEPLSG